MVRGTLTVRVLCPFKNTGRLPQAWSPLPFSCFCLVALHIGKIIKRDVLRRALGPDLASTSPIGRPWAQLVICLFERAG